MASEQAATAPVARRRAGGSASATLVAGARLRKYCIGKVLRLGGPGITYRARDTERERDVAIKEYLPVDLAARQGDLKVMPQAAWHTDGFLRGRQLFLDEARSLVGLAGAPGLIPVEDCFEDNGTAYMVMAWVPHDTLAARLAREGCLSPQALGRLLPPLLDGLESLHAAGLVHLDIKPATIAFDAGGAPALFDPGAVRAAIAAYTESAAAIAATPYTALEQLDDGETGPFTDIYGLAATLHHGVTGAALPPASDRLGKRLPPVPRDVACRHDPQLLSAIAAGLAVTAAQRPASITAWRSLLERGDGISAAVRPSTAPGSEIPVDAGATAHARTVPGARGRATQIAVPRSTGRWRLHLGVAFSAIMAICVAGGLASFDGLLPAAVERQVASLLAAAGVARAEPARERPPPTAVDANRGTRRQVELPDADALPKTAAATAPQLAAPKSEAEARRDAEAAEAALRLTEPVRKHVQEALTSLGLEVRSLNGTFGPRTRAMIAAWQKTQGAPATGFLTAAQLAALLEQGTPAAPGATDPAPKVQANANDRREAAAVEAGMQLSERDRRRVQVALTSLGHDTGGADGQIMTRTRQMIAAWQKRRAETQTGYLTPTQLVVLWLEARPALERYDRDLARSQRKPPASDVSTGQEQR